MSDQLTRRDLLTRASRSGDAVSPEIVTHISSAVISVLPGNRSDVVTRLAALAGAELHFTAPSKLVLTLEGASSGALGAMLADISGWPGVLAANMVFEQRLEPEQ